MQTATHPFIRWLLGLTTITRYLVIALLFHIALVVLLGTVKIAIPIVKYVAYQTTFDPPQPPDPTPGDTPPDWEAIDTTKPITLTPTGPVAGPTTGVGNPEATTSGVGHSSPTTPWSDPLGVETDKGGDRVRLASALPGSLVVTPGRGSIDGVPNGGGLPGPGNIFGNRTDPEKRNLALKINDGSKRTEQSVLAGLRWLRATQKPDGSWEGANPAVTGLAVLAFLGHGETADSREFGRTVSSGLHYLQTIVPANGNLGNMYHQGIVGIALAEGLELTHAPALREPLERIVNVIVEAQKTPKKSAVHKWGWRYTLDNDTSDLSVSGWQIMALKSARHAGLKIPDEVFDHAADYVWNQYGAGGFGYSGPGATASMTGVGVLCEIFLGNGKDRRLDKALDLLNNVKIDWDNGGTGFYLYGWYYTTLSMFQGSALRNGGHWPTWNKHFQRALVDAQTEDGHWELPGKAQEAGQGKGYCTSFCTLMLEVYYRYSLIYEANGTGRNAPPARNTGGQLPISSVKEPATSPS